MINLQQKILRYWLLLKSNGSLHRTTVCIPSSPVGRCGDNVAYTRNVDESLSHINKQSHKFSATGFIGGMEDNGRNRDS